MLFFITYYLLSSAQRSYFFLNSHRYFHTFPFVYSCCCFWPVLFMGTLNLVEICTVRSSVPHVSIRIRRTNGVGTHCRLNRQIDDNTLGKTHLGPISLNKDKPFTFVLIPCILNRTAAVITNLFVFYKIFSIFYIYNKLYIFYNFFNLYNTKRLVATML